MPATAARSNAAVPDDSAMTNLGTPPRRLMMNWISTRPRRPMRALCGITESQLMRTAASTCTRYGLKSTPAGSLRSCRLLRAGPGEGAIRAGESWGVIHVADHDSTGRRGRRRIGGCGRCAQQVGNGIGDRRQLYVGVRIRLRRRAAGPHGFESQLGFLGGRRRDLRQVSRRGGRGRWNHGGVDLRRFNGRGNRRSRNRSG